MKHYRILSALLIACVSLNVATVSHADAVTSLKINGLKRLSPGICTSAYTVRAFDASGAISKVPSSIDVSLNTRSDARFYADAKCTQSISSVKIKAGTALAQFYVSASEFGDISFTASSTGLNSASMQAKVTTVQNIIFAGPETLTLGVCTPISLNARDEGNLTIQAAYPIAVEVLSVGPFNIYSDASCKQSPQNVIAIEQGAVNRTFYVRATREDSGSLVALPPENMAGGVANFNVVASEF